MTEFRQLTDDELQQVTGGVNWPCYGACLLQHGAAAIPELAKQVENIRKKDWGAVAGEASRDIISALPIASECLSSC